MKYTMERTLARIEGKKWYGPKEPCSRCGMLADRRVEDNRCRGCFPRTDRTPRQLAEMDGKKKYRPEKPCPRCGTLAWRRTTDGKCFGCILRKETWEMMEAAPDMIISREDARWLHLQVFRTGKPCPHGHTGFRTIMDNDCIDCINRRRKRGNTRKKRNLHEGE